MDGPSINYIALTEEISSSLSKIFFVIYFLPLIPSHGLCWDKVMMSCKGSWRFHKFLCMHQRHKRGWGFGFLLISSSFILFQDDGILPFLKDRYLYMPCRLLDDMSYHIPQRIGRKKMKRKENLIPPSPKGKTIH